MGPTAKADVRLHIASVCSCRPVRHFSLVQCGDCQPLKLSLAQCGDCQPLQLSLAQCGDCQPLQLSLAQCGDCQPLQLSLAQCGDCQPLQLSLSQCGDCQPLQLSLSQCGDCQSLQLSLSQCGDCQPLQLSLAQCGDSQPLKLSLAQCGDSQPLKLSLAQCGDCQPLKLSLAQCGDCLPLKLSLSQCGDCQPVRVSVCRHTLELTATVSGASPETLAVVVYIQDPVDVVQSDSLLLSPASVVIPLPDGTVTITASVTNSSFVAAVLCLWDFGVTNGINDEVALNLPGDFPVQQSFAYDATGKYTVELRCRNTLSSGVSLTSTVEVFGWDMEDFQMDLPEYQPLNGTVTNDDFPLKLKLNSIQLPPSGITASFTYGDSNPDETLDLKSLVPTHRYPRRGVYPGSVHLDHPAKGNTSLYFTARVGMFQFSVDPPGALIGTTFNFLVETLPNSQVMVNIYANGTVIYSMLEFKVQRYHSASHVFETTGIFVVCFEGRLLLNGGGTISEKEEVAVEVEGVADSTLILTVNADVVLTPPGGVTADVLLNRTMYGILNLTCQFFFDEGEKPEPLVTQQYLEPNGGFSVNFEYRTLGSHDIVVNCSNRYSYIILTEYVFAYHPCFSDDPIFDRQYRKDNPMVVLNSVDLRLVTRTIIYCPLPSFWWWLEEFTPAGIRQHTDLQQPYVDFIEFERGALEPGLYSMRLNISFGPESKNTWLVAGTFVKVVRAPLVAEIAGGSARMTGEIGCFIS